MLIFEKSKTGLPGGNLRSTGDSYAKLTRAKYYTKLGFSGERPNALNQRASSCSVFFEFKLTFFLQIFSCSHSFARILVRLLQEVDIRILSWRRMVVFAFLRTIGLQGDRVEGCIQLQRKRKEICIRIVRCQLIMSSKQYVKRLVFP